MKTIEELKDCPPVLFIIFNRPAFAEKILASIRGAHPTKIFIAADGPRQNVINEMELCQQTRDKVLEQIDWDCEIKTLFQNDNLGCGLGPLTAINWFFENVEEGIILEDDCLPADSFFSFCEQMLSHYRNDKRVIAISGTNILQFWDKSNSSYFFSYYGGNWGWATWKRAWSENDPDMIIWKQRNNRKYLEYILGDKTQAKGVANWFDTVVGKESDFWDFQWFYSRLMSSGLSIVPARNMITNIGFGSDATHTFTPGPFSNLPLYDIQIPTPINPIVVVDREFDMENAKAYGFMDRPTHFQSFLLRTASFLRKYGFHGDHKSA